MPAKGQSQTEETKKKISEALYKGGPKDQLGKNIVRSKEAQSLFDDYVESMAVSDKIRTRRDALKAKITALGRKKGSKAQKDTIRKEITALNAKLKAEKSIRYELRKQALQMKRVKMAKSYIEKSNIGLQRLDIYEKKISDMVAKSKKPETLQRIKISLDRIKQTREKYQNNIEKAKSVIEANGQSETEGSRVFNFSEILDTKYKPFRKLTMQEERCNFEYLNEQFNELQDEMQKELTEMTDEEIDKFLATAEKRINAGDIAAIALLGLLIRGKVKKVIDEKLVAAYEVGKKTATNEINKAAESDATGKSLTIDRAATPLEQTQLKNLDVSDITDGFISEIEQTAKGNIKNAIAVGAATAAIITTTKEKMKKTADKMISNLSATLIGQYVNRGRKQVFEQNIKRIVSFQRSEILDGRTCEMCRELDELTVKADDPMAQMDLVHSFCRGVWIPIFLVDEIQPDITGIPSNVLDSFDLVDGRPVVNSFRQLKKTQK